MDILLRIDQALRCGWRQGMAPPPEPTGRGLARGGVALIFRCGVIEPVQLGQQLLAADPAGKDKLQRVRFAKR